MSICPKCKMDAVDVSKPEQPFWRCSVCRQAIIKINGRLLPWIDENSAGTKAGRKKFKNRARRRSGPSSEL